MYSGLYAEYDAIRVWGRYEASPQYYDCPPLGGGVGSWTQALWKTSSLPALGDRGTRFGLEAELDATYFHPDPVYATFSYQIRIRLFGNVLYARSFASGPQPPREDRVPRHWEFEFILVRPRFYIRPSQVFVWGHGSVPVWSMAVLADGWTLTVRSNDQGADLDDDLSYEGVVFLEKYCHNPATMPFLGNGMVIRSTTNTIEKEACAGSVYAESTASGGYSYKMPGEDVWKSLPTVLEYRFPDGYELYPSLASENTDSNSVTSRARRVVGTPNQYYRAGATLNILPNRRRRFRRMWNDNTRILVLRGTYPPTFFKIREGVLFGSTTITREPKHPKRPLILEYLEEDETPIEGLLGLDLLCPYEVDLYHSPNIATARWASCWYGYDDPSTTWTNARDGVYTYDPNAPIFALLYPTIHEWSWVDDSRAGEVFSLIHNTYSFWNWVVYFPPDEDDEHWKWGVPLQKVLNDRYWYPLRTQYAHHLRLPTQRRFRTLTDLKAEVVNNSEVATRTGNWFNYNANYWNGGGSVTVYTPDEVTPGYPGMPISFPGFHNPRVLPTVVADSVTATDRNRYAVAGGTTTNTSTGYTINPTSTTVVVEYSLGATFGAPHYYDLVADQVEYEVSGSTIQNVRVEFISVSGEEVEVYSGPLRTQTLDKTIRGEPFWAGTGVLDYNASLVPNITLGNDIAPDSRSAAVLSAPGTVGHFSLLCSPGPSRIRFTLTLQNTTQSVSFNFLKFKFRPTRRYHQVSECANIDCLVDDRGYFRWGQAAYYDEFTGLLFTPQVKGPTYRMSVLDACAHRRRVWLGQGFTEEDLRNELEGRFDPLEPYRWDVWGDFGPPELVVDDSIGIAAFAEDTYCVPISSPDKWQMPQQVVSLLYGNYWAAFPPNPCLPQYSLWSSDLSEEIVYLFAPYRRFVWNYDRTVDLYEVEYTDDQNETELTRHLRSYVPNPQAYTTYPNVVVREFTRPYTGGEVVRRWNNTVIRTPKWLLVDTQDAGSPVDLTRVSPFHTYTYNRVFVVPEEIEGACLGWYYDLGWTMVGRGSTVTAYIDDTAVVTVPVGGGVRSMWAIPESGVSYVWTQTSTGVLKLVRVVGLGAPSEVLTVAAKNASVAVRGYVGEILVVVSSDAGVVTEWWSHDGGTTWQSQPARDTSGTALSGQVLDLTFERGRERYMLLLQTPTNVRLYQRRQPHTTTNGWELVRTW